VADETFIQDENKERQGAEEKVVETQDVKGKKQMTRRRRRRRRRHHPVTNERSTITVAGRESERMRSREKE